MARFNLQASYFAIENPLRVIDRWIHRPRYRRVARLRGRDIEINWTRRAEDALRRRTAPLTVEIRLYFSCVVKKQVYFHDHADFATTPVDRRLLLAFRPVTAAACDPREFAENYPPGEDLADGVAARMLPRVVDLDYCRGRWHGRFAY